jgi:hypothetical protein
MMLKNYAAVALLTVRVIAVAFLLPFMTKASLLLDSDTVTIAKFAVCMTCIHIYQ